MSTYKYSTGSAMQLRKERTCKTGHGGRKASSKSLDNISHQQTIQKQLNS